jgi:hypothetical protein
MLFCSGVALRGHQMAENLKYFAYISRAKTMQLHEQITDYTIEKKSVKRSNEGNIDAELGGGSIFGLLKAGMRFGGRGGFAVEEERSQTTVQQLSAVTKYIEQNEKVLDLGRLCRRKEGVTLDAFAYSYSGSFFVLGDIYRGSHGGIHISRESLSRARDEIVLSKDLLIKPAHEENSFKEIGPNNGALVSNMCIIASTVGDFTLHLACSLKYFSDMGGSWKESEKEWSVSPHSGNYHFFKGETEAWFDSLVFLNGIRGNTIMGTPLFLIYGVQPGLTI